MRWSRGIRVAIAFALVAAVAPAQAGDPPMFSGHGSTAKAKTDTSRAGKPGAAPKAGAGSAPSAAPKAESPHGSMGMPGGASPHGSMPMPGMGGSPHGGTGAKAVRKPPFKLVLPPGLPKVSTVTLEIRHRVFHDFLEVRQVPLKKLFQIGDTDYAATVTDFVPDFTIDVEARKIGTISKEPVRPAFRVIVREKGAVSDTTWAFMDSPPHFSMKSLLAFEIVRIDFVDRAPVTRDTTRAAARDSLRTAKKEQP